MRLVLAAILLSSLTAPAMAQSRPVVVELFTSQGCSSCPPADALLGELAKRPDILPLAFHITYWDRLGWRDPFSLPLATERQRDYQRSLGTDTIYTPQMVVEGRQDVIGSDRSSVREALSHADTSHAVAIDLNRTPDGLQIAVGAGAGSARLLLVGYDSQHRTAVMRGENAGRQLSETNVVRSLAVVADWQGAALSLAASIPPAERAAVILQARDGRILGAAVLPPLS